MCDRSSVGLNDVQGRLAGFLGEEPNNVLASDTLLSAEMAQRNAQLLSNLFTRLS
jgi:hypothetical protein